MSKTKTLRDWVPYEFAGEFDDTPAAKLLDYIVVQDLSLDRSRDLPCPLTHRYIFNWCVVSDGKKVYAVGWNENPAIGWSFPIKRMYNFSTTHTID